MRALSFSAHGAVGVLLTVSMVLSLFFTNTALAEAPVFQVYERPDGPSVATYVPGEVVFKYKNDNRPFRVMQVPDVEAAIEALQKNPNVAYAEANPVATAAAVPNDPLYAPYQWHFDNPVYGGVHAEVAWDTSTGAGAVVAVIDSGVAYENYQSGRGRFKSQYYLAPDLAGTCFVQGYDFINNDTHANDDNAHGTHVAGTIAQTTNNNEGVAGLAHDACIMPIKALDAAGSGSYTAIANAIYFAVDNGADVINMSLSGPVTATVLEDAVQYAYDNDVTVVAATGNDNGAVQYPAVYDTVIAVGATRYDEARAPYSNFGPEVDVVAPGGDTSVDQNGDGYIDGVLQQTINPNTGDPSDIGYWFFDGTSMATPHVAAAAAMVIARGNATTPDEVRAALETTADDLGVTGRDDYYGHGLINVPAALAWTAGPVDNAPTVSVTAPTDGVTVVGDVLVTAAASDDVGVDEVQFYVDDVLVGIDSTSPYEMLWNTASSSDGQHEVKVTAVDTVGQTADDMAVVTVNNIDEAPVADAGTDQAVEDVDGSGSEMITLDGSGSSDDGTIVNYSWRKGGAEIAVGVTSSVDLAVGVHVIDLVVTDDAGATDVDSVVIEVTPQVPQPDISLVLTGSKERGRHVVTLDWSGTVSINVDVYRNGSFLRTEPNDGNYVDRTGSRGGLTYTYQVCEEGSMSECSVEESITF